jgi:hypothetical protein
MNPLYRALVDLSSDCVPVISLVDTPAIEVDFEFFSSNAVFESFTVASEYEQKIAGPILIPDKRIYRVDDEGKPYDLFFDKSTVAGMAEAFSSNLNNRNITIQHTGINVPVVLVETWLTGKPDKSESYGYELPEGTWFGVFRVMSKEFFDKYVVTGKVKGFSIETQIQKQPIEMKSEKFSAFPLKGSDKPLEAEALEVGKPATVDGQPAPDGRHELEDGTVVVIAEGVIAEVKPVEQKEPEAELAEEPVAPEAPAAPDPAAIQEMVNQIVEQRLAAFEERILAIEDSIRKAGEASSEAMRKVEEFGKVTPAAPSHNQRMADQLKAIEAIRKGR